MASNLERLFGLRGRVALVTGSSRGIGRALAAGLAEAGARVVVNGRSAEAVEAAAAQLVADGGQVHAAVFDVTDGAQVRAGVARIEAEIGPIDILVNNAGVQRRMPLEDFPEDGWRDLMATNLDSVFLVGQAVARAMIPRGAGASSISARCRANSRGPASRPTRRPKGP